MTDIERKEQSIDHETYMNIFLKGQEHTKPSKETLQLISDMKGELKDDIKNIEIALAELPKKLIDELDKKYVSKEKFYPIKVLVFGFTGIILASAIGALVNLVIKQ